MSLNVTIGLNAETLAALNALTAAIVGVANVAPAAAASAPVAAQAKPAAKAAVEKTTKAATKAAAKVEDAEEEEEEAAPVTIYWFSSASDEVGVVESEDEYKALKKADSKTVKITEAKHDAHIAKQEAAAAAADEEEEDDNLDEDGEAIPTEQDIIDAFGSYLPTTLSDKEKAERRPFVKAILDRFGAKKATALAEDDRRLAINLVERKMAGEDVDPAEAEYEALDGLV